MAVADHLIEVDRLCSIRHRAEQPARLDLAELLGVAEKDELRLRALGVGDQPRQRRRVHHPRLVHEQHRSSRQSLAALVLGAVQLDQKAGDARRRQALGAHHVRRPPGRSSRAKLDPGLRPALGRGDDGEGLAGARLADHDGDPLGAD